MSAVVIGMDPHKRSATIEVMASDEAVLSGGRYGTDASGYRAMLRAVRRWPERTWAVEGCQGIGRHIATRLIADGEHVVDVPPKLSARTRVFATGQGRKTDATDAHSVALAATRMTGLRPVIDDEQLAVLRILADRRRSLGEDHTRMISWLHQLLLEPIPGGAKKALSAAQARELLAGVRPRDAAGKARRRVAAELISDLERIRLAPRRRHFGEVTSRTRHRPAYDHSSPSALTQRGAMRVSPMPTSLRRTRTGSDAFEHGLGARRPHRGMIIDEHLVP